MTDDDEVKVTFEPTVMLIPLTKLLPSKQIPKAVQETMRYRRIIASVGEIGLVEPLVVSRGANGNFLVLDGHVRLEALGRQSIRAARCIISQDDESFTYNKRVSRPPPIQEHYMIVKALEKGVSEEKLARSLSMDVKGIRARSELLKGISTEVAEILKDKSLGHQSFNCLRKMKAIRQLEVAELMISANNFSANYAKALLATTRATDLHKPEQLSRSTGLTVEQMAKLEREMSALSTDYKEIESSYGDDMLVLVVASGFLERMLSNRAIASYLKNNEPEFAATFESIVQSASLDVAAAA